jgi:hypothetical protein
MVFMTRLLLNERAPQGVLFLSEDDRRAARNMADRCVHALPLCVR